MKQIYYKAVRMDRTAFWDEETKWGVNMPVIENPSPPNKYTVCGRGYHLAKSIPDVFQGTTFPLRLAEAEPLSPILGEDKRKIRVAHARIVRWIPQKEWPGWLRKPQKFINSISKIKWFENHGKIDPKWKVFETWEDAADYGADSVAYYAAFWAGRKAAEKAALYAAYYAAGSTAGDAAYSAAYYPANDTAGWAAGEADRDASLRARILICASLDLDPKHIQHTKDRWDVWQKGYGLFGDLNGTLYVYKKP